MKKKPWSKGRKQKTCLVRIEPEIYELAKDIAYKYKMTMKAWVSCVIKEAIETRSK